MGEQPKIVVIHPPQEVQGDYIDYPYFTNLPARSLAVLLKEQGYFVHLLDAFCHPGADYHPQRGGAGLFGWPFVSLFERLADADFDIAIVHFTPWSLASHRFGLAYLIERLRLLRPQSLLIGAELYAGGMHRLEPDEEILREGYPELDCFVTLEGEVTIPQLISGTRMDTFLVAGKPAPTAVLERAIVVAWGSGEMQEYKQFLQRIGRLPKVRQYRVDEHTLPVYFSRGCPYSCTFCSNPCQDYRPLALPNVELLLDWAVETGFNRLFVLDDAANVRGDFDELLKAVAARELQLEFPNGLRADLLSAPRVELLARVTGQLTVSAESASPRLQRAVIGKRIDAGHIENAARWCRDSGVPLSIHWMVGIPGETRAETVATLHLARTLLDEYGAVPLVQYATPLPGTALEQSNSQPVANLGHRMQHQPTFLPVGVEETELTSAVSLLRQRAGAAGTAKVIINLTYRCNNHCAFCAVGNRVQEDQPFEYVVQVLEEYAGKGVRLLDLDGGEPTLYPQLLEVIARARELGYSTINVTTNGRRLSYPDFARKLLQSGISSLLVSVHGPDAATHDEITGAPGSFGETLAGLHNIRRMAPESLDWGVNTTLSTHNYQRLDEFVELMHGAGVRKVNIQFLTPFGRAAAVLVPPPEEAAARVRLALERWRDDIRFQVINLPFCYLPGMESYVGQDLGKLSRNMVFVTKEEVNLYEYLAATRQVDDSCRECLFRVACDGRYDFSEVLD